MSAFGYSPTRAEEIKVGIEADLAKARHAIGRLKSRIPGVGVMGALCDAAVSELEDVAADLQAEVDRRTDEDRG